MKINNTSLAAIVFMIIGIATRFMTFVPNFSAVEAIALMGGAYIATRTIAFLIPIVTLYLSDLVLNNTLYKSYYPDTEGMVLWSDYMSWNFASMILITLVGFFLLKKVTVSRVIGGSLLASVIFFLVTNFGAWYGNAMYTQNIQGLMASYIAGLPFLKNSALSALVFSGLLFGSFELYKKYIASSLITEEVEA